MDFVLLGLCLFYFFRGYFKGFVSMLFSILGTFFIVIVSWKLSATFYQSLQNLSFFQNNIFNMISNSLNSVIPGSFADITEFQSAIMQTKFGVFFAPFLKMLIGNISFDGELSAGQILAPVLNTLVCKIICFIIIFLLLFFVLNLLKLIFNKIVKVCGLTWGNKWLGGLAGLLKGVLIFGVFYITVSALANFLMNETLLNFVKNGEVSNFLYENLINKIISFFY